MVFTFRGLECRHSATTFAFEDTSRGLQREQRHDGPGASSVQSTASDCLPGPPGLLIRLQARARLGASHGRRRTTIAPRLTSIDGLRPAALWRHAAVSRGRHHDVRRLTWQVEPQWERYAGGKPYPYSNPSKHRCSAGFALPTLLLPVGRGGAAQEGLSRSTRGVLQPDGRL